MSNGNGKTKVTLIQRFDDSVLLIGPNGQEIECLSPDLARETAAGNGWVVEVDLTRKRVVNVDRM